MGLSIWQIAIVAILVILLFGRGKLSGLMTDLATGIRSFRQGLRDDVEEDTGHPSLAEATSNGKVARTTESTQRVAE